MADQSALGQAFARLLDYEVTHQGEFGIYRVVFTALTQSDDAEINGALVSMHRRFQKLVRTHIEATPSLRFTDECSVDRPPLIHPRKTDGVVICKIRCIGEAC